MNIVWTTNKEAISWVELAPDDQSDFYEGERKKYFASKNGLKEKGTLHNVRIDGLEPDTRYRYRVYSKEVLSHEWIKVHYGDVTAAMAFMAKLPTFKTDGEDENELNFVVINDMHERNDVIGKLLAQVDWKKTDMVLFNGDMMNDSRSEEQIFSSFMDLAQKTIAEEIPMYYARGNHETRGEFADKFQAYFPSVSGKLYYILRKGPVCFVVLDTGEDKPDSDIEYYGIADFDTYRDQQAAWLEKALKSPEYKEAKYKVVVGHIPPFGGWHGNKEVREKFIPLLNRTKADIMLAAHLHRPAKRMPEEGKWDFPILVNSNHSILKATADEKGLKVEVFDLDGQKMDEVVVNPK